VPTELTQEDKNLIECSVRDFFNFLKENECDKLAINKDGLSELSHSLGLWAKARYSDGIPKRQPMEVEQGGLQEYNSLQNISAELKELNDYRF